MKNNKYIYIGGGVDPGVLSILMCILKGYKHKEEIIIERSDFKYFQKYLEKKKIKYQNLNFPSVKLTDPYTFNLKNLLLFISNFIKNFFFYTKLLFFFSYKDKINYKSIFSHAYWDSCMRNINDNELKPNLFIRLKTLMNLIIYNNYIKELINKKKIKSVFFNHSVYKYRIALEEFKKKNIKVFSQANFSYFKQKKNKDVAWSIVDKNLLKKLKKNISAVDIEKFWSLRSLGKLDDIDFTAASKIKSNSRFILNKNIIFLHVFRDSPFTRIDKNRIFFDYYDWIIETIKILKDSDETWSIRIHPISKAWGENTLTILKCIENKYFKGSFPDNIKIDNKFHSNLKAFSEMNRCVTFNGTASIESSCYGKKPILISENALSELDNNYVLKPTNIKEYRDLLLKNSSDKIFIQEKKAVIDSKFLLYLIYNVLSFKKNLFLAEKELLVFSNNKLKNYLRFVKILKKLGDPSLRSRFYQLGFYLRKNSRSLNLKFLNLLNN